MNDTIPLTTEARAAADALATTRAYVLPAARLSRILDDTSEDRTRFGRNWDDLLLDQYMADGGPTGTAATVSTNWTRSRVP